MAFIRIGIEELAGLADCEARRLLRVTARQVPALAGLKTGGADLDDTEALVGAGAGQD